MGSSDSRPNRQEWVISKYWHHPGGIEILNMECDQYDMSRRDRINFIHHVGIHVTHWKKALKIYASRKDSGDSFLNQELKYRFATEDFDNECDKYNLSELARSQIMYLMVREFKIIEEAMEHIKIGNTANAYMAATGNGPPIDIVEYEKVIVEEWKKIEQTIKKNRHISVATINLA